MTDAPLSNATAPSDAGGDSIFGPMHLTRVMIGVVAVIFAFAFRAVAQWLHWPREMGCGGSLAQPPMALGAFVAVLILLVVCTAIGTLLLGRRWFLAGLMATTAGLATWSARGGTMTQVLFNADNNGTHAGVFLQLLGELIVFFGVIGGLWNLVWTMTGKSFAASPISEEAKAKQDASLARASSGHMRGGPALFRLAFLGLAGTARVVGASSGDDEGRKTGIAVVFQTVIMAVLLLIFAVTPLKKQALTSVFLAGLISTAVTEFGGIGHRSTGRWYWIAPLIVGAVGYLVAYFNPAGIETGDLQGMFAPLARVLPLDYASLGCAGVLFGYWWMEPDADEPTESNEGQNSTSASESKAA